MSQSAAWADAVRALTLFAADPVGLGGIAVRAGAGPVRDRFLALLTDLLPVGTPVRRLPLHVADDRLLGGLDLAATLQAGRPVAQKGLLAEADGGVVVLAMAERIEPGAAARLRAVLDEGVVTLQRDGLSRVLPARFGIVALDEGAEPDERVPGSLLDRMAFHVDLTEVSLRDADVGLLREAAVLARRGRPDAAVTAGGGRPDAAILGGGGRPNVSWPGLARPPTSFADELDFGGAASEHEGSEHEGEVAGGRAKPGRDTAGTVPHDTMGAVPHDTADTAAIGAELTPEPDAAEALCHAAHALGIDSPRPPLLALRTARVAAAQDRRRCPNEADLGLAARLVLAPRATRFPPPEDAEPPPPAPEPEPPDDSATPPDPENLPDQPLEDVVLEAALAALPPDLLAKLAQLDGGRGLARAAGRAGQFKASNKRGRPVGTRQGEPKGGARLHLLETLKAAAPWQTLRRRSADAQRFEVRRDDFRIIRFRQRIGTTTIFAVDASGSAAMARLGEAKGAVELLLADCYVRRDQVALLAFRGTGATLLLAPTGSLLRAKRCLAGLPGGGPTPLAAGIEAAATLAGSIRRAGRTPVITLLTDARANIGRDGSGGRPRAEAEALEAARALRAACVATLLVDTSPRPNPFAKKLADEMQAQYVPLPYADATALSRAVRSVGAA